VAEYLDNTLPPQQVVDFEQACLGEDARLAEVASCHQILTIVLAKPAVISEPLKQRIRQLGTPSERSDGRLDAARGTGDLHPQPNSPFERNEKRFRIDAAHQQSEPDGNELRSDLPGTISTAGLELDDKLISHVPEYLRSGKSGDWSNGLIIVGLLASLLFVAWLSLGPLDDVRSLLHQKTLVAGSTSSKVPIVEAPRPSANPSDVGVTIDSPPGQALPSAPKVTDIARDEVLESNAAPPVPTLDSIDVAPPRPKDVEQIEQQASSEVPPVVEPPTPGITSTDAANVIEASAMQWQPETKASATALVFATSALRDDPLTVRRLAVGESISTQERMVVPAAFRTELSLTPGIRWIVADESVLAPMATDVDQAAAVDLRLGRGLIHATPDCQKIVLQTPIHTLVLRMNESTTIVSVELRYTRMAGQTLEQVTSTKADNSSELVGPALSVVCVEGTATIELSDGDPVGLRVGEGLEWRWDAPRRSITRKEIPWWYQSSVQRPIDAEAAVDLENRLSVESDSKSMIDLLRTSRESRRNETAALAMRTLFLFGDYSNCFGSDGLLSNPTSRPHRSVVLESLYQSLGADTRHAALLKSAIETMDPMRAPRLLGLIGLPDDSQLADGFDRGLVESLSSPFVDERVLGIFQLSAILGKEFGYQSDRPNSDSIQQWKRLLNLGKIRWPKTARD
jgi:hypothetical protein